MPEGTSTTGSYFVPGGQRASIRSSASWDNCTSAAPITLSGKVFQLYDHLKLPADVVRPRIERAVREFGESRDTVVPAPEVFRTPVLAGEKPAVERAVGQNAHSIALAHRQNEAFRLAVEN